jgi:hypothetical protein
LFGPPAVVMVETYADRPDGPQFDDTAFDAILQEHVDDTGLVDYLALKADPAALDAYIGSLASAPLDQMGRDQRLALLINGYNAFTLRLILDHHPVKSIKDIPADQRWDARRWNIAGNIWSLNQIEHEQIRPHFREPRIHFALVCAALGCPPLRREAYVAARIEEQLHEQSAYVHSHDRWYRFDADKGVVHLTELYNWYGDDFEQVVDGSVLDYAARYDPRLRAVLLAGDKPRIAWINYDWSLNSQENQPQPAKRKLIQRNLPRRRSRR